MNVRDFVLFATKEIALAADRAGIVLNDSAKLEILAGLSQDFVSGNVSETTLASYLDTCFQICVRIKADDPNAELIKDAVAFIKKVGIWRDFQSFRKNHLATLPKLKSTVETEKIETEKIETEKIVVNEVSPDATTQVKTACESNESVAIRL